MDKVNGKKIAIALSGGGDSYIAGKILLEKGAEVFGVYMRHLKSKKGEKKAKEAAKKLGIKLYVFDLRKEFEKKVVDYFCKEHKKGRNPNPCVVCNKEIKFGLLLDKVKEKGAEKLATGHYVKLEKKKGRFVLKRGEERKKDQGYAMSMLGQEVLKDLFFPLGEMKKSEIRKILEGETFKPEKESKDLCFLDCEKEKFLIEKIGRKRTEVFLKGKKIGERDNYFFIRGQRKGLGVNLSEKFFVNKISEGKIELEEREKLMNKEFLVEGFNCQMQKDFQKEKLEVSVRDKQEGMKAWIEKKGIKVYVKLDEKTFGLSKGQLAVFYKKGYVFGGGWIEEILD